MTRAQSAKKHTKIRYSNSVVVSFQNAKKKQKQEILLFGVGRLRRQNFVTQSTYSHKHKNAFERIGGEEILQYTVMIVEDDEVIAEMVKGSLERWDYEVVIASDLEKCRRVR